MANHNILRKMISLSNNSQLTNEAAVVLDKLDAEDLKKLERWFEHAERQTQIKIQQQARKF